jgi:hypothetical protein
VSSAQTESVEQLERELLAFDVDQDISDIIPMPATIPTDVRRAISRTLADRYEFADALDAWLHASNEALGGSMPLERIAAGDWRAFLLALSCRAESATLDDRGASGQRHVPMNPVR